MSDPMQVHSFAEFDEFAASIHNVESRMMFRNPERRIWRLAKVDVDRMVVQHGQLGSGNIAQGQLDSDSSLLYLPLTPATEYVVNGVTLEEDSLAILEPGCEFCIATQVAHDWATLSTPINELAATSEEVGASSGVETRTLRVTHVQRPAMQRFRAVMRDVVAAATACPGFESSPAAKGAAAELLRLASIVQQRRPAGAPPSMGRPRIPRATVIRRCQEWLEQHHHGPVQVGDLAAAADVTGRTLRTVFHEYFGVSPHRYLALRQLHEARRALRAADPEAATVTEILAEIGVWELGRFAKRYRQQFGELPSATLRGMRRPT